MTLTMQMIRDATESDLPCLMAGMLRLQETHVRAFPDVYRRLSAADATSHLSDLLACPTASVRVAIEETQVVAHAVMKIETRPESIFTHSQRFGHIAQIEVEPEFRRKGHGRLLLQDCEEIAAASDVHRIILDVWEFNALAKSFFYALGYNEFGSKLVRTI